MIYYGSAHVRKFDLSTFKCKTKPTKKERKKERRKKRLVTFKTYQVSFVKYTLSVLYGGLIWGRVRYCLQGLIINYDFIILTM